MSSQKRNKIPAVYLNDGTHQAMKKWAAYQGLTMPQLAQHLLEEMQPVLEEMIKSYEDILSGQNALDVLQNLMASGLTIAGDKLKVDVKNQELTDVTVSRKSD